MVAPIRVTVPSSTRGSSPSCCALLKRWTSSTNNSVRAPASRLLPARSNTLRRSATPSKRRNRLEFHAGLCGQKLAMVVLPVPGGPQMIDANHRHQHQRSRPSGPEARLATTSARLCGRNSSASGESSCARAAWLMACRFPDQVASWRYLCPKLADAAKKIRMLSALRAGCLHALWQRRQSPLGRIW